MKRDTATSLVEKIMSAFARRTGLYPESEHPRRYLWTDAFAVCNFLELQERTGNVRYLELALSLVEQVHHTLGRHRRDDGRSGWLSGLGEEEGEAHPTAGGLRIGKAMPERRISEPYDERREWDQDGQYYHYLTKWMHALNRVSRTTGRMIYNRWAVEMAATVHARFTYSPRPGALKRMYWKMSIDLSHPLVPSMGHHDPLDGLVTYLELQAAAANADGSRAVLEAEIAEMTSLCEGQDWSTGDPLGMGGLLCDAYRVAQLTVHGRYDRSRLLEAMTDGSIRSMEAFARRNLFMLSADYRLAFRELGLSIGLRALAKLKQLLEDNPDPFGPGNSLTARVKALGRYTPLADTIERFWLDPTHQQAATWLEHEDINTVMLATSLAPDGFLAH